MPRGFAAGNVRYGVVGAGLQGEGHIKITAALPNAELVSVCDIDEGRARSAALKYGAKNALTDYNELFEGALKDLENVPWNIVLLFGGAMSIGFCLWETGAAQWLAIQWLVLFKNAHWLLFIMGTAFFVLIMTNLIMNVAAIAISLPVALVMAPYLNVAPEVVLPGSILGHVGRGIELSGELTDAGVLDLHTATIDWGDGTVEPATVVEADGSGSFSGGHDYATEASYDVEVCVEDDDGGRTCKTTQAL